jgi:exo-beta-1,3-glucanase (GH17 family)
MQSIMGAQGRKVENVMEAIPWRSRETRVGSSGPSKEEQKAFLTEKACNS